MNDVHDSCLKNKEENYKKQHSYKIIRALGRGAFGTTYLVEKQSKMYVLKSIKLTPKNISDIYTEIDVLKKIAKSGCRKDILCYHDQFVNCDNQTLNIVTLAFEDSITLTDYIKSYQKIRANIPRKDILKIMYNLANGFNYLSELGIAHSDIKPDNILINEKTLDIQIIDFGLSCIEHCKPSGTIMFASPEVLRKIGPYAEEISVGSVLSSDVFSLGIVFYLLANLKLPYSTTRRHQYEYDSYSDSDSDSDDDSDNDSESSVAEDVMKQQKVIPGSRPIDISNELAAIGQLYKFYKNNLIISMYNDNQTDTDKQINELIESMLKVDTSDTGRPSVSTVRKVLAKLKAKVL